MSKKIKKMLGALLFSIAVVFLIPLSYAEAESTSASDFQMKGETLVKYTGGASSVTIPASIKSIGKEAFAGHTEIKKISIPGYVDSIAYNAFSGCSSLEKVLIPDMVTEIGNGAFSGCTSLKSVKLGKKLEKLGSGVFANCTSLSELRISKDNKEFSYEEGVIYSMDKTIIYGMIPGFEKEQYTVPAAVKTITDGAFWGCHNLKKVEIGGFVQEIPDYAFANCKNLEKVMFPYSLTSIGLKSFADCINLGETEIPISVSEIHKTAFDGCPKLKIIAEEGSKAAEYEKSREKSNVAQSEYQDITKDNGEDTNKEETTDSAAENNTENSGSLIGQTTVVGGNAVVFIDNNSTNVLSGNIKPEALEGVTLPEVIGSTEETGKFPKYTIIGTNKIAAQAYYGDTELFTYDFPEKIEKIGDFAFARSGLTSVNIPEGVTTIGYGAFYHCDKLASVTIPSTVTQIEPSAFDKTGWMEELLSNRSKPFTIVGDGILLAYSGMGNKVEIPEGVKQIGAEVFMDRDNITSVILPASLVSIGEDAFSGCSRLASISGGSNLQEIKDRAFAGCPISTIKISDSVKEVGLKAFDLSNTEKENAAKVAVFLGKELPKVSFEKTATRLVNEEYRDSVLKDVKIVIVDKSISAGDIEDTVLDYDKAGFRGYVCTVEQTATTDTPGKLQITYCVMQEKDVRESDIPKEATVYGKQYEVVSPEEMVFLSGSEGTGTEDGTVQVEVNSSTLPGPPEATAVFAGSKENYILQISDNTADGSNMSTLYKKASAGNRMTSLQVYNITLLDKTTMIPISKLGQQQMTITLPKPKGILENGLKVLCLDEDGQLEKVDSRLVEINGETCVQFNAEHFSVYGIYN